MHAAPARRSSVKRCSTALLVVTILLGLAACSGPRTTSTATPSPIATTLPGQPALASDPALLGADLAVDEQALRDPSSSEGALVSAALRQQAAYRAIGRHPEWEATVRGKIPASLVGAYERNVSARHHLAALNRGEAKDTLPAWRIEAPAPADVLLGLYHEAEGATGVGWNYLAAINLVETGFGRIIGPSTAGAQGPMQFLPSTFASYGNGGDIASPHDSILAAGRSWPQMASPATATEPSSRTTTPASTSARSTTTPRCWPAIRPPSRATTGGISTTSRHRVTCSCPSATPRPSGYPSPTTWRVIRSKSATPR